MPRQVRWYNLSETLSRTTCQVKLQLHWYRVACLLCRSAATTNFSKRRGDIACTLRSDFEFNWIDGLNLIPRSKSTEYIVRCNNSTRILLAFSMHLARLNQCSILSDCKHNARASYCSFLAHVTDLFYESSCCRKMLRNYTFTLDKMFWINQIIHFLNKNISNLFVIGAVPDWHTSPLFRQTTTL